MSKVLAAALGAAGALAVANTASADTQVQVQSGDTVWGFAQQYATTVDSISTANQLADPNVIYVGQQLVIPSSAISAASAAATVAAPTATDNATASQAAVETTETTAASTTPAVSATNASNVADQAQPTTVVSAASDNNTTAQVSAVSQVPAQVSAASATISVAQISAVNTNNNVTTLTTTTNTAAPTQTTYAATEAVATVQSTAAVTATPATSTAAGQGNGSTANAVAVAQAQIGTPYVWGGNQPGGFDCSGLVQYAYGLGSNYRTTYQQTNLGAHHSDIQNAQSGDLYFWGPDSAPYHVAIATGNGGYIQAPTPGQNVQTGNINYYTPSFYISMN